MEMLDLVRQECERAKLLEFEAHCHDCDVSYAFADLYSNDDCLHICLALFRCVRTSLAATAYDFRPAVILFAGDALLRISVEGLPLKRWVFLFHELQLFLDFCNVSNSYRFS